MTTKRGRPAATIKFFKPSSGGSESEDSDVEDVPRAGSQQIKSAETKGELSLGKTVNDDDLNPFADDIDSDDSDFRGRDREESIYDTHEPRGLEYSRSTRTRTDSDSNYLPDEDVGAANEPLILDMMADHFGLPEDLSRLRDVNEEIEKTKQLIYTTPDENPDKRQLIVRLVNLRLRKGELESVDYTSSDTAAKTIYGHEFHLKESTSETERYCEVCCAVVWGVIHNWYTCVFCHVCCHDKCLNALKRMCASRKVIESSSLIMTICKDRGLAAQNYKCFECQALVSYKAGAVEPRQCDYTGNYYCPQCHWNDEVVIPARVIHNWDFEPRRVCRASKQYLRLMYYKPIICPEKSNAYLLNFVEELSEMKKLRNEILLMKVYFLSCQFAMQSKILRLLEERLHFVENADHYTMHDLVELVNERLLSVIVNIHASFASHIKLDCATCRGKGYICEICQKPEILFPFDNICILCPECSNVFHKYCFAKANQSCMRCERKLRRQQDNERKAELLRQIEEANSS